MNRAQRRPTAFTRPRRVVAGMCAIVCVAGCGGTDEQTLLTADVPETVALGEMPDPLSNAPTIPPPPPPPSSPATTDPPATTTVESGPIDGPIGSAVVGDRVLFVGDATLASAAPGNSSRLCDALTLFGWDVEFAAAADDLGFVAEALDERFAPDDDLDWDVVALFVGNELPADTLAVTELAEALDAAIERVAPRPVVLYTVSEVEPSDAELNDVIRSRVEEHPNVVVIDWAELGGDASDVIADDGVSLTDDGLKRLSMQTAAAFQEAPVDQSGDCMPAQIGDTAG